MRERIAIRIPEKMVHRNESIIKSRVFFFILKI
jgi:hypothetical protein